MSEEETEDSNTAEPYVEALLKNEDRIRNILDDIGEMRLYDGTEARRRLKMFARDSLERQAFAGLYFTLEGTDQFFEDVEDEMGSSTVELLNEFKDDFGYLGNDIEVIWREVYDGFNNPPTTYDTEIAQIDPATGPILTIKHYSGSAKVYEVTADPGRLLGHAASLTAGIYSELSDHERYEEYSSAQIERLDGQCDHLEQHLEDMKDLVEEIKESRDISERE